MCVQTFTGTKKICVLKGDNLKINTIHQKLTVAPRPVLQLKTKQQNY
jgi:hypothetical protein